MLLPMLYRLLPLRAWAVMMNIRATESHRDDIGTWLNFFV